MGTIKIGVKPARGARASSSAARQVLAGVGLVPAERIHLESAAGLAELDHTGLEVVERTFDQTILLLVMSKQVMPQWVLWAEH